MTVQQLWRVHYVCTTLTLQHEECEPSHWPALAKLGLSASAVAQRSEGIGGSDANIIISGDAKRIRDLWLQKRGEGPSPDLSSSLPAMLGCWTEEFNRQWFQKITAKSVRRHGDVVVCDRYPWRRCTLDGVVQDFGSVWEAKHTNAFSTADEVVERYMPQLQHNMAVVRAESAFLSVIFGNHKFEVIEVAADWLYQLDLLEAEGDFWDCVVTGREPVPAPVPAPPRPVGTREISLEGNNRWTAAAADWRENRTAAKAHASASKALKELVEDEVARAFGHGIEAKRSRAGAITLRELA